MTRENSCSMSSLLWWQWDCQKAFHMQKVSAEWNCRVRAKLVQKELLLWNHCPSALNDKTPHEMWFKQVSSGSPDFLKVTLTSKPQVDIEKLKQDISDKAELSCFVASYVAPRCPSTIHYCIPKFNKGFMAYLQRSCEILWRVLWCRLGWPEASLNLRILVPSWSRCGDMEL